MSDKAKDKDKEKNLKMFEEHSFVGLRYDEPTTEKRWNAMTDGDKALIQHVGDHFGDNGKFIALIPGSSADSLNRGGAFALALDPNTIAGEEVFPSPDSLFGYKMCARIIDDDQLSGSFFKDKTNDVLKAIESEYARKKPATISRCYNKKRAHKDKDEWNCALLGPDSELSVRSRDLGNKRKAYYLYTSSSVGKNIGNEIVTLTNRHKIGDLLNDPKIIWAKNFSKRNCQKLLKLFADALGVEIATTNDPSAFVKEFGLPSRLAVSDIENVYNTMARKNWQHPLGDTVVIYNGCGDISQIKDSILLSTDPVESVFAIAPSLTKDGKTTNLVCNAVPVETYHLSEDARNKLINEASKSVEESVKQVVRTIDGSLELQSGYARRQPFLSLSNLEGEPLGLDLSTTLELQPVLVILNGTSNIPFT